VTDRYEFKTYDMAYSILPNGDIVTSDGLPRAIDDIQLKIVKDAAKERGEVITFQFRSPTEKEKADLDRQHKSLQSAFEAFLEVQK